MWGWVCGGGGEGGVFMLSLVWGEGGAYLHMTIILFV